ncbi:MAG: IS110 family transposase [Candidatus Bathyarchaeota archaeon]|nr:IS110 family transposase [Candidatus Bathyarchaeota archaeon]
MFCLGIDVSKKTARYLILDESGNKLKSFTLENGKEALESLPERLESLSISKDNLLIGIEATGGFWENIYSFLKDKGFHIVLLNPYNTNKFREALAKKAKTDDIDALVIAQLLRTGEYVQSQVAEENIQALRELTTLRYEFMKERKNLQRQVYSLLNIVFPEYGKTVIAKPFSQASMAILMRFPTAKHLSEAKTKHIEKIVRKIQGNNFSINEIQELIETAKNSIYSGRAKDARAITLRMLLSHIQNLSASIEELEKQMKEVLSPSDKDGGFPGENILSMKGVGEKTLAAILSYLGSDGSNFSSSKAAVGYVGFYPKIYESGQSKRANTISKRGPKVLRWALYMAAVASIKHNKEMRTLYHKKLSQGKTEKQALICVGKKILQIALSLLKSGESYNPARVFVSH